MDVTVLQEMMTILLWQISAQNGFLDLKKLTTQILFHDQNWHVFSRDDDFFEKNQN